MDRRLEAKKHWRDTRGRWAAKGLAFMEDVKALEDPVLFDGVRIIIDCISHGYGALVLAQDDKDTEYLEISGLWLDDECRAKLAEVLLGLAPDKDPSQEILRAHTWIVSRLTDDGENNVIYAGWLLGKMTTDPTHSKPITKIWTDRIVWDMKDSRVSAIRMVGDNDKAGPEDLYQLK